MRWSRLCRLSALAAITAGCSTGSVRGAGGGSGGSGADVLDVLFVGNSLTSWHGMPFMLESLLRATGDPAKVAVVAFPDFSLEDHFRRGDAREQIDRGGWRVVVLQQGSSALPESRVGLREWTRRFADPIQRVGARPGLYMVWPWKTRAFDFDRVVESYTLAAADVGGMLFPVGEAWRAAWRRDRTIDLYELDGLHPSRAACYLAALVFHGVLTGRSPVGLPAELTLGAGEKVNIPPELAGVLQAAAAEANEKFSKR